MAATSGAMGGRTARVCDSCSTERARWFCAADDAFLCQACDVSVHSANQLAMRHDRIRLETASFKSSNHLPSWLMGLTRKARTPRPNNNNNKHILSTKASVFSLVPEIGNDDEDEHSQFFNHQQVPVFDPPFDTDELEEFGDGFLPSEVDLAEFVADVESLLEEKENEKRLMLKIKDEEEEQEQDEVLEVENCMKNNNGDILEWNLKGEEIEEKNYNYKLEDEINYYEEKLKIKKNNIFLRLNYDAVITAWDHQSSPYTTGNRPQFDFHHSWGWVMHENGEKRGLWKNNGEREARVLRYREKRRTRLFSKKIRYQVRKMNAEKRPRMKGRFVKRTIYEQQH